MALIFTASEPGIGAAAAKQPDWRDVGRRIAALALVLGLHGIGLWLVLRVAAELPTLRPARVVQVSWIEGENPLAGSGAATAQAAPAGNSARPSGNGTPRTAARPAARRPKLQAAEPSRASAGTPAPRLKPAKPAGLSSPVSRSRPVPADGGGEPSLRAPARPESASSARSETDGQPLSKLGTEGSSGSAASLREGSAGQGGGQRNGTAPGGAPAYRAPRFDAAYLSNPAPDYPAMSREMGEEGRVFLRVRVSTEGRAVGIQIHRSSGYERLDEAAVAAVRRWRFVPGRLGSEAVTAQVIVPINFYLR